MSKAVNSKWKKTFPDTIGNQNRPATGVDDTQPFETGAFPQYMANDPVRYDLQNAAMSQSMSNDARLKEMVDARGKELDDHKVDPGAHKTGIAGNAATATKVVANAASGASANIAEASMASSDFARIRVSGASDAGELALETADNGDEAIVARQYTGTYEKVARTASILDKNGNTSFPGTVVAPNFTGSLNGNAATATKLQTPRTLSLTGKAAGSATFDGSANASINVTSVNADTASKLSTARKINITGNATGSAPFDGTSDINISTTVNESKHAAAADVAKTLETTDANGAKSNGQFYWVGKDGQPMWLWGSNTKPSEMYVYNPSNFHVAYADNATNAATATTVNATAPNGGTADLVFGIMANDDSARIRVGGSSDNGWLEIATSDNGNEPIYARQYSGGFGQNDAKTVTNEAILLDGNGNTKFPHNVTAANFVGHLAGNADSATTAANANKLSSESGSNYLYINTTTDSWSVLGPNSGQWLKSIRTEASAPPYSIGNYSAAIAFGGSDTKGIITHAYDSPSVKFAGGNGSTASWKFTIYGGSNNETYDLNSFPTKTGGGASGTWGINISGNAASATNADKLDGYHASDIIGKIQDITPKTAAAAGQFRELVVNDSHQIKLPDGGTWAYFVYTYNSWSGDDSNGEHRTRTGAGIAAGGTVLHTDDSITSNTINAFKLSGTAGAGGADGNTIIVGGFCWRIA